MGGGDLNLKKSWHPQTLRNVEKVWKAEQKAAAEAKKIEQLRKELQDERAREEMQQFAVDQGIVKKKGERLDWMYSTPGQVNHEEYLLGKVIDKKVDPLSQAEDQDIAAPSGDSVVSSANDLAAKVREDPLLMIKKKEDEKKRELLNNPVRMKQIQLMLRASMDGKETSKKDRKKKKKKDKKDKRRARESSSSESDIEKSKGRKKQREISSAQDRKNHERLDRKYDYHADSHSPPPKHRPDQRLSSYDRMENQKKGKKSFDHQRQKSPNNHRHRRSSSPQIGMQNRKRSPEQRRHRSLNTYQHRISRSRSSSTEIYNGHSSPSPSPVRHRHKLPSDSYKSKHKVSTKSVETKHKKSHHSREKSLDQVSRKRGTSPEHRSQSPVRKQRKGDSSPPKYHPRGSNISRKLDPEELERRRAEMMGNAQWRDERRKQNVTKYREEEAKEDQERVKNQQRAADFIQPMKLQSFSSTSTSSIQDRIKRNIHSVQRTPAALDNFLKK